MSATGADHVVLGHAAHDAAGPGGLGFGLRAVRPRAADLVWVDNLFLIEVDEIMILSHRCFLLSVEVLFALKKKRGACIHVDANAALVSSFFLSRDVEITEPQP